MSISRLFAAVTLFAMTLSAADAEPHPSLPPPVIPDCLGVNIHFTDPKPGELEMLAAAGFRWVRMDFHWAGTEQKKGEYDFSAYDRLVAALDQHKLRAVFILDYGNKIYPKAEPPTTDEARAAFASWAVAAVSHFKGRGYLWEMWNEPNGGFWKSANKTNDYIALAKATGEALRQAGLTRRDALPRVPDQPGATPPGEQITPEKSGTRGSASLRGDAFIGPATSTIDLPYLEACFKAGLLEYWDAVSVHPYRQTAPETVEEEYRSVRLLIRKYAPAGKQIPVVSGEWGYSTQYSAFKDKEPAARDELQAKWLARQFLTNIANDVALSIWYDWHDDGTNPTEPEHHFGVVAHEYHPGRDPVYDPKPAYTAMKTMMEQLGGFRFNKRLIPDFSIPTDSMCLFTKGDSVNVAIWSSAKPSVKAQDPGSAIYTPERKREVQLPISAGEILSVDHGGRRKLTERAGADGLSIAPSDTVEYLVPKNPNSLLELATAWERAPLEYECQPPKQERLQLTLSNVTGDTLYVGGRTEPIPPGAPVPNGSDATPKTRIPLDIWGDYEPIFRPRHAYVDLAQPRWVFTQRFVAVVKNAVTARVFPPSADFLPILIENPSGVAWKGHLNFWYPSVAGTDSPTKAKGGQVNLAPGETEKMQRIPMQPLASKAGCRIQLWEGDEGESRSIGIPVARGLPPLTELQIQSDGDAKTTCQFSTKEAQPIVGPSLSETVSVQLGYQFGSGWKFIHANLRGAKLTSLYPESSDAEFWPSKFGLWLHGDAKGCQAHIRFKDKTGQVFQPDGPKIDWQGWRYVTFPMQSTSEKPLARWGGANDGVIHYPIEWDSIFLLDNVSRQPVEGEIYLSAPTLIY